MEIPVYSTKEAKVNLVANYLMDETDCGWLILIGSGGNGKSMATGEAISLWKTSLGEDGEIIELSSCDGGFAGYKTMLMKRGSTTVKTILHVYLWCSEWEFVAKEWNATVARFERGDEPYEYR